MRFVRLLSLFAISLCSYGGVAFIVQSPVKVSKLLQTRYAGVLQVQKDPNPVSFRDPQRQGLIGGRESNQGGSTGRNEYIGLVPEEDFIGLALSQVDPAKITPPGAATHHQAEPRVKQRQAMSAQSPQSVKDLYSTSGIPQASHTKAQESQLPKKPKRNILKKTHMYPLYSSRIKKQQRQEEKQSEKTSEESASLSPPAPAPSAPQESHSHHESDIKSAAATVLKRQKAKEPEIDKLDSQINQKSSTRKEEKELEELSYKLPADFGPVSVPSAWQDSKDQKAGDEKAKNSLKTKKTKEKNENLDKPKNRRPVSAPSRQAYHQVPSAVPFSVPSSLPTSSSSPSAYPEIKQKQKEGKYPGMSHQLSPKKPLRRRNPYPPSSPQQSHHHHAQSYSDSQHETHYEENTASSSSASSYSSQESHPDYEHQPTYDDDYDSYAQQESTDDGSGVSSFSSSYVIEPEEEGFQRSSSNAFRSLLSPPAGSNPTPSRDPNSFLRKSTDPSEESSGWYVTGYTESHIGSPQPHLYDNPGYSDPYSKQSSQQQSNLVTEITGTEAPDAGDSDNSYQSSVEEQNYDDEAPSSSVSQENAKEEEPSEEEHLPVDNSLSSPSSQKSSPQKRKKKSAFIISDPSPPPLLTRTTGTSHQQSTPQGNEMSSYGFSETQSNEEGGFDESPDESQPDNSPASPLASTQPPRGTSHDSSATESNTVSWLENQHTEENVQELKDESHFGRSDSQGKEEFGTSRSSPPQSMFGGKHLRSSETPRSANDVRSSYGDSSMINRPRSLFGRIQKKKTPPASSLPTEEKEESSALSLAKPSHAEEGVGQQPYSEISSPSNQVASPRSLFGRIQKRAGPSHAQQSHGRHAPQYGNNALFGRIQKRKDPSTQDNHENQAPTSPKSSSLSSLSAVQVMTDEAGEFSKSHLISIPLNRSRRARNSKPARIIRSMDCAQENFDKNLSVRRVYPTALPEVQRAEEEARLLEKSSTEEEEKPSDKSLNKEEEKLPDQSRIKVEKKHPDKSHAEEKKLLDESQKVHTDRTTTTRTSTTVSAGRVTPQTLTGSIKKLYAKGSAVFPTQACVDDQRMSPKSFRATQLAKNEIEENSSSAVNPAIARLTQPFPRDIAKLYTRHSSKPLSTLKLLSRESMKEKTAELSDRPETGTMVSGTEPGASQSLSNSIAKLYEEFVATAPESYDSDSASRVTAKTEKPSRHSTGDAKTSSHSFADDIGKLYVLSINQDTQTITEEKAKDEEESTTTHPTPIQSLSKNIKKLYTKSSGLPQQQNRSDFEKIMKLFKLLQRTKTAATEKIVVDPTSPQSFPQSIAKLYTSGVAPGKENNSDLFSLLVDTIMHKGKKRGAKKAKEVDWMERAQELAHGAFDIRGRLEELTRGKGLKEKENSQDV